MTCYGIPVRFPVNVQVSDPCGNNGRGETINFNGYGEVFTVVNPNPAGGDVAILHLNLAGGGVGETTGIKYQFMNAATETFTLNGQSGAEITEVLAYRLISQGSDQNSIFHINVHITLTPDGTITAAFVNDVFITC